MSQPNVAIDTIPLVFTRESGLQAVVAPRKFEPHFGAVALPGVLLLGGESVLQASYRALESKAGITEAEFAQTLGVYDDPGRDPRSTTLTIAQIFAVSRDVELDDSVTLVSLLEPGELPFDHARIISDAAPLAATLLDTDSSFVSAVLGSEFETNEMAAALSSVGAAFSAANLARSLAGKTWLFKSGSTKTAAAGRPAAVWKVVS